MADDQAFTQADIDKALADQKAAFEKETAGLKSKVEELLTESKTAKAKAKEEAEAAAKAAEEAAKKTGDVQALEKSWQEKFDKAIAEANAKSEGLNSLVSKLTAGNAAKTIAAELAVKGSEKVLEALIAPRIAAEFTGDDVKIVVRGTDGKPSALTLDDLKKEISGDAAFKPILAGTNGSGGGAAGSSGGAEGKTVTRAAFDTMSHVDRATFAKSGGKVIDG